MEALKVVVKSLVVSSPINLTVEKLLQDYKETEGHALPYSIFGYKSSDEMLRHMMRDVVQVQGFGAKALVFPVDTSKCEHIAKMVKEQKVVRKRNHTARPNPKNSTLCSRNNNANFRKPSTQNTNFTKSQSYNSQHRYPFKREPMNSIKEEIISTNLQRSTNLKDNLNGSKRNARNNNYTCYKDVNFTDEPMVKALPGKAIDNRAIAHDILHTYQKEIAEAEEDAQKISSACANGTALLDIDRNHVKNDDNNQTAIQKTEIEILEEAFSALNILDTHKEEDHSLNVSESLTCSQSLPDTDSSSSDIFFKPKETKGNELDKAIPNFAFNNSIFLLDFPEYAVKFGTKIKPFQMPKDVTVDSIISIYITEIHNPYRFWFHLYTENYGLDELMLNIERFYAHKSLNLKYTLLPELIQPGQVCAAPFGGFWHRAEILTNLIIDNTVKVFFMDYGTVYDVEVSSLKYLRIEFAELPAFAFRGSLAEITPVRLHWSTASSVHLLSMSYERLLHAKVCEIDLKNRVYYLSVCDNHTPKVVHLNRELIVIKEAYKSCEWVNSKQLGCPRLRHKREDYPTFEMLEVGEYPTLSAIIDMEEKGINYEAITDKLIYHPHILNFDEKYSDALHDLPYYLLSNNPFASDVISELTEKANANKT